MHLISSSERSCSLSGAIAVVDGPVDDMPLIKIKVPRSGPGEHEFNERGELILPPVAHGTPAQKRDAIMTKILEQRLWVHFARTGVEEVAARGCINPRAKMMLLSIGVLIDFGVPSAEQGGLKGVLDKYGNDQGEELARHLDMNATVVEFLKPHINRVGRKNAMPIDTYIRQVSEIQEMLAPYHKDIKEGSLTSLLTPSMLSSRTPSSYGGSSSGSDGILTPAKNAGEVDIGPALSRMLDKLEVPQHISNIASGIIHP